MAEKLLTQGMARAFDGEALVILASNAPLATANSLGSRCAKQCRTLRLQQAGYRPQAVTKGRIEVTYSPGMSDPRDCTLAGHGYHARHVEIEEMDPWRDMILRDDLPDLAGQLVAELRRIAAYYAGLADQAEQRAIEDEEAKTAA